MADRKNASGGGDFGNDATKTPYSSAARAALPLGTNTGQRTSGSPHELCSQGSHSETQSGCGSPPSDACTSSSVSRNQAENSCPNIDGQGRSQVTSAYTSRPSDQLKADKTFKPERGLEQKDSDGVGVGPGQQDISNISAFEKDPDSNSAETGSSKLLKPSTGERSQNRKNDIFTSEPNEPDTSSVKDKDTSIYQQHPRKEKNPDSRTSSEDEKLPETDKKPQQECNAEELKCVPGDGGSNVYDEHKGKRTEDLAGNIYFGLADNPGNIHKAEGSQMINVLTAPSEATVETNEQFQEKCDREIQNQRGEQTDSHDVEGNQQDKRSGAVNMGCGHSKDAADRDQTLPSKQLSGTRADNMNSDIEGPIKPDQSTGRSSDKPCNSVECGDDVKENVLKASSSKEGYGACHDLPDSPTYHSVRELEGKTIHAQQERKENSTQKMMLNKHAVDSLAPVLCTESKVGQHNNADQQESNVIDKSDVSNQTHCLKDDPQKTDGGIMHQEVFNHTSIMDRNGESQSSDLYVSNDKCSSHPYDPGNKTGSSKLPERHYDRKGSSDQTTCGPLSGSEEGSSSAPASQYSPDKDLTADSDQDGNSSVTMLPKDPTSCPLHENPVISGLTARLLQDKVVRMDLFEKLMKSQITVDLNQLSEGLVSVTNGSLNSFFEVLASVVQSTHINLEQDDEGSKIMNRLQEGYPGRVQLQFLQSFWHVVFHTSVESEVNNVLQNLKTSSMRFRLPVYIGMYLKRHRAYIWNTFLCYLPRSAAVDFEEHALLLTVKKTDEDAAVQIITLLLGRLMSCRVEGSASSLATGLFLDNLQGPNCKSSLEERCVCTISIEQPGVTVLLKARSVGGHQVMLCQGSMASTDCHTIILPLYEGQVDWTRDQKDILHKGFLPVEIERYQQRLGPGSRKQIFKCQELGFQHRVIVMHMPPDLKDKRGHFVVETLVDIVKDPSITKSSLAIPVMLHRGLNVTQRENLKVIVTSITDSLNDNLPSRQVRLYVETDVGDTRELYSVISENLLRREWSITTPYCGDYTSGRSVKVAVGNILDFEADVVVNSAHLDLQLEKGIVSKLLLEKAGKELSEQCKKLYPEGLRHDVVAVTDCFRLKHYKKIFHVHLPDWDSKDPLIQPSEWLRTQVQSCLGVASALGYKSIVFPTLGTGTLKYPPEKVAQIMFTTFREFFMEMPHSSVIDVTVVCYSGQSDIYQYFKLEEARYVLQLHTFHTLEKALNLKGALFHILRKPHQSEQHAASELVIRAGHTDRGEQSHISSMPGAGSNVYILNKKKAKHHLKNLLARSSKDVHTVSMWIDLYTFGDHDIKDIVDVLEKHVSDAKHLKVVTLVVDSNDQLRMVHKKLSGGWGPQSYFNTLFGKQYGVEEGAKRTENITVCGLLTDTLNALKTITDDQLFEEFRKQTEQPNQWLAEGHSSAGAPQAAQKDLEMDRGAVVDYAKETALDHQSSTSCLFTIPKNILGAREEDINRLRQFNFNFQIDRYNMKFTVPFEQLCQNTVEVCEKIREIKADRQPLSIPDTRDAIVNKTLWTKEVDILEHEALCFLLGQTFTDQFSTHKETNGMVIIASKGSPPEDVINKIETLRREDVPVDGESCTSYDMKSEGIEAFVKALPQQSKVAVFAFGYDNFVKAKHLLLVKTGKIKTTSRSTRRFDPGRGAKDGIDHSGQSQQSSQQQMVSLDLTTGSGKIKVFVSNTDITKLPVDAIVNAANEHLQHGGGVAYAILNAAGAKLEVDCGDYIYRHGPLKVTQVVATSAGNLPCRTVLHVVGPRWSDYKDKAECAEDLVCAVFNCLWEASNKAFTSVAVSSVSSAIFGVPQEICAKCYLAAVKRFDNGYGQNTRLRQVHFVDVNKEMASIISNTFRMHWESDIRDFLSLPQSSTRSSRNPVAWEMHQHREQSSSPASQSEMHNHQEPETHQYKQQTPNSATQQETDQQRQWPSSLTTQPETIQHTQRAAGLEANASQHSSQNTKIHYRMETFSGKGQDGTDITKFNFQQVHVFFQTGRIMEVKSDAYVMWQRKDFYFQDRVSQSFLQCPGFLDGVASYVHPLLHQGQENVTWCLNESLLVFPVMASHKQSQEELHKALLESLHRASRGGAKSICIPKYPYTVNASDEELRTFAVSLYTAVTDFSKSLTGLHTMDICIIGPDERNTSTMVEYFAVALSKEVSVETRPPEHPSSSYDAAPTSDKPKCSVCLGAVKKLKTPHKCGHTLCEDCIDRHSRNMKLACPKCQTGDGFMTGDQPRGTMKICYWSEVQLSGFPKGAYSIDYDIPGGKQTNEHPDPGQRYRGIKQYAYLPDTEEGRKVLVLLKIAFDRRLLFTVNRSPMAYKMGQVIWNDIQHKSGKYGYADENYLQNVQHELAVKGVTEKDIPTKQKNFILDPSAIPDRFQYSDFSHCL